MARISTVMQRALKDKAVAMAIIGQAIIDEGAIGVDGSITVSYTSYENAYNLWKIANAWGLVHPLRKKLYKTHTKWVVAFKAEKREEIYKYIGPLPDPRKNKMFRHILRNPRGRIHKGGKGEVQRKILELLKRKPLTIREISYALDLSGSTVRKHLKKLAERGKVTIIGVNKNSLNKNQRTAHLWYLRHSQC